MTLKKKLIKVKRLRKRNTFSSKHLAAVLLTLPALLIFFNHNEKINTNKLVTNGTTGVQWVEAPKYWGVCLRNWHPSGNLRTMDRVFDRLGYVPANGDDWDVLWSIEFPFLNTSRAFDPVLKQLKQYQRINHFPGSNYITAKSFMTTRNRDIKHILPGFIFPEMINEFKAYVEKNPKARFVEKALDNRGIRLVNKNKIIYDKSKKFYQLFLEKPFLVEGRFMDFSTFVLISSIDPLRIYRFELELLLRFCPEPYYPFNPNKLDKYVVSESRKTFLELPNMKHYHDIYGYSFKLSIEDYFRKKGKNVTELWTKIDKTIVQLVLNNEKNMLQKVRFLNIWHLSIIFTQYL